MQQIEGLPRQASTPPVQHDLGPELFARFIVLSNKLHISYWATIAAGYLARLLPLRLSYGVAWVIGYGVYLLWKNRRDNLLANLRQVFGDGANDRNIRRIARRVFTNYFKSIVDFLRLPGLPKERIARAIETVGWEHLNDGLKAGKGVIFVSIHFGSWDLAGAFLASRGYPVSAIADRFPSYKMDGLVNRQRTALGLRIIPSNVPSRDLLMTLRRNEILGLAVDLPVAEGGVTVEFFGAPISVPAGAAALALKTGAVLLPAVLIRNQNNSFKGYVCPPLRYQPTGDRPFDLYQVTQKIMTSFEKFIRDYPDQWYMFRRMWTDSTAS